MKYIKEYNNSEQFNFDSIIKSINSIFAEYVDDGLLKIESTKKYDGYTTSIVVIFNISYSGDIIKNEKLYKQTTNNHGLDANRFFQIRNMKNEVLEDISSCIERIKTEYDDNRIVIKDIIKDDTLAGFKIYLKVNQSKSK